MGWWSWFACAGVPALPPADVVFTGGRVHPMDDDRVVQALVVDDGRVVFAGDDASALAFVGPGTERVDLGGATVLPGFTDAHNHLLWSGADLLLVDLYAARDLAALEAAVTTWAAAHPDEPWVQGGGWALTTFVDVLDRDLLDAWVPDRPVYLYSADAHSAVVNSLALELAGIDADTPDPVDGTIVRDGAGEPTGLLLEGGMGLVEVVLPPYSDELADEGLRNAQREANSFGVTNVVDPLVEPWMLAGYVRADNAGALTVRVHGAGYVDAADPDPVVALEALRDRFSSPRVEVNAGKLFLDGVLETQTAYLLAPYVDGTNGTPVFGRDHLYDVAAAMDAAGFQLHAHVIGDGAVRQLLDAVAHVEQVNGPRDRRPLAAHIELVHPDDVPRFAALGVLADAQPLWAYPDSYIRDLTWPVIGPERSEWLYPFGSLEDAGAVLVGGSDWSVTSQNPWEAIEVMVRRSNPWRDAKLVLVPEERVSLDTAIRAYTADGARASFSEDELGTLSVGARADLVVLDRDPWAIPVEALSDVVVTSTWLDGEVVWEATGAERSRPQPQERQGCPTPRVSGTTPVR